MDNYVQTLVALFAGAVYPDWYNIIPAPDLIAFVFYWSTRLAEAVSAA